MADSKKELLSTFEVAKIVGVHYQTVNSWVRKGWLPAARTPGGHRRIRRADLDRFLSQHNQGGGTSVESGAKTKHILIVEDEKLEREFLYDSISPEFPALLVTAAADGYDAGRKLSRIRPDLIFLDLMMPGVDGFHVLRDIRSDQGLRETRVVVLTGYHTRENAEKALGSGADLVLTKPIRTKTVFEVVRHLVLEEKPPETIKVPVENVEPFFE
jgi:excisionase family DNA binding protein